MYVAEDFFLARIPYFSLNKSNVNVSDINFDNKTLIRDFIQDKGFQEGILVASPSLYESMKRKDFNIDKFNKKMIESLQKYIIRAMTRTTPFGLFCGVGIGTFSTNETNLTFNREKDLHKKVRVDMRWLYKLVSVLENNRDVRKYLKVKFNPLAIVAGERIYHEKDTKVFETEVPKNKFSSVKYTKKVEFVKSITQKPIIYEDLLNILVENNPYTPVEVISDFVDQLFMNGFLISDLYPPELDVDPLEFLINKIEGINILEPLHKKLILLQEMILEYESVPIGDGSDVFQNICSFMTEIVKHDHYLQVDLGVNLRHHNLNYEIKKEIEKVGNLFSKLPTNRNTSPLSKYKELFLEKYGYSKKVPLIELLDEDIGLGVPANFKENRKKNFESIEFNEHERAFKSIINRKIVESLINNKEEVVLEESDFKSIITSEEKEERNISFELNFKVINSDKKNLLLEIGPNTGSDDAGRSFGRFYNLLESNSNLLHDMFQRKKRLYGSQSVLADVYEIPDHGKWSNVSLSSNNIDFQIPILTEPSPEKEIIDIKDIFVGVDKKTNLFYLYSNRLSKVININVSNMLNYRIQSKYCRFIKEVSFNQVHHFMSWFDLLSVEELPFTPRIKYSHTILKPACWRLNLDILEIAESQISKEDFIHKVDAWRLKWKVSNQVFIAELDQFLINSFDTEKVYNELYNKLVNKGFAEILLYEINDQVNKHTTDEKQKPYLLEIAVPFLLKDEKSSLIQEKNKVSNRWITISNYEKGLFEYPLNNNPRRLALGVQGWIYLKLFPGIERDNDLITKEIKKLEITLLKDKIIDKYFFVRYSDFGTGYHIRLRLHCLEGKYLHIIKYLQEFYNDLLTRGVITAFSLNIYEREIERYGGEKLINYAEDFFFRDSQFVSNFLNINDIEKELYSIVIIKNMLDTLGCSLVEELELLNNVQHTKLFRHKYRQIRKKLMSLCANSEKTLTEFFESSNKPEILINFEQRNKALLKYWEHIELCDLEGMLTNSRMDIILSLIHMFNNRLHGDNNKEYELMVLLKDTVNDLISLEKYNSTNKGFF